MAETWLNVANVVSVVPAFEGAARDLPSLPRSVRPSCSPSLRSNTKLSPFPSSSRLYPPDIGVPTMGKRENTFSALLDAQLLSEQTAREEDQKDPLSRLRNEFIIPSKADLNHKRYGPATPPTTDGSDPDARPEGSEDSIYLCGNSLGLQPRRTRDYINKYLDTWASKGVFGHFKELEDGGPPWLHLDDAVKDQAAQIVGALPSEVAVMETLTANLHLLMASFYRPTKDRYKIIIEGKAFPSDHVSHVSMPTRIAD